MLYLLLFVGGGNTPLITTKSNNNKEPKEQKMIKTLKDFKRDRRVTLKIISADSLIGLKKYDGAHTSISASLDGNGRPVTGLTEDWVEEGPKGGKIPHKGTRLEMERLLDLAEGTLKPSSAYWITYRIPVGADPITLDLADDFDLLKYLFAYAQSNVANSIKEIESNSQAEFVMFSEEQEAIVKVAARSALKRAYVLSDQLDQATKIQLCNVYGYNVSSAEPNTIENKIMEVLEKDPEKFLSYAEDEDLLAHSIVSNCLDVGILEMREGGIYHGDISLGYDKLSAGKALAKDSALMTILKAKLSGDMDLIKEALAPKAKVK